MSPHRPPPSPPPPPGNIFSSHEAFFDCSRGDHLLYTYGFDYESDHSSFHYDSHGFNQTGLHHLSVHVDSDSCLADSDVLSTLLSDGHTISLFSSPDGVVWTRISELVYQQPPAVPPPSPRPPPPDPSPPPPSPPNSPSPPSPPPPPSPSPPPPSPSPSPLIIYRRQLVEAATLTQSHPNSIRRVHFASFPVTKAPLYVRACIDCDGSCNGIDTIDALVSCHTADDGTTSSSLPWWVWLLVALSAILLLVTVGMCVARFVPEGAAPTPNPTTARPPVRP